MGDWEIKKHGESNTTLTNVRIAIATANGRERLNALRRFSSTANITPQCGGFRQRMTNILAVRSIHSLPGKNDFAFAIRN
ncbi:hypothetical protein RISK_004141 [Rhodopirellula islandica]|uniref:Uncharacterized protein n=1 Tax=Rhodopirellula islandica TaxID=595434 RepID=A0A0J1EDX4_RHOIS|nr:hypothetical protein RISK_004141 [Rhodopirellula islandica]